MNESVGMLQWVQIFLGLVVVDVLYAIYTKQIQKDNAVHASLSAGAIYLINALVVISFVNDANLLIPAVLGAIIGTFIGVKINHKI